MAKRYLTLLSLILKVYAKKQQAVSDDNFFASNLISNFRPSSVEKQLCFSIIMHPMLVQLAANIFCRL